MLAAAFGASTAESWVRRDALNANPALAPVVARFDALENSYTTHLGATADQIPTEAKAPQTINARPGKPGPMNDPVQDQHQPTVLFDGMVNPILPYAARDVIWYQGESIVGGKAGIALYPTAMATLVKGWCGLWGEGDFPFYVVQLAALDEASNNPLVTRGAVEDPVDAEDRHGRHDRHRQSEGRASAQQGFVGGPLRVGQLSRGREPV